MCDSIYDELLSEEALLASDWAQQVREAMPSTLLYWEDEDEDVDIDTDDYEGDEVRDRLYEICQHVLASPKAIAHPDWGELVRAVVELSADYAELTEDAYGEALDPDDAADDEGGVVDMITDEELSTIEDAFTLLAIPDAVQRPDWPELVRYTLRIKAERFGTGLFLSGGWEEADAMFEKGWVRAHPDAQSLWDEADEILPLESERPE